ncbi:MAG: DUF3052 domain-containing protein [Acidimicrobiales bacterium]
MSADGADPGSSTALAKKLGIKEAMTVALVGAPRQWTVPGLPPGARLVRRFAPDASVVVVFVPRAAELGRALDVVPELGPTDALWVAWPRRAAGHDSDVTDEVVRQALLPTGLVDVKVAALGEDWSGLRFVWRLSRR